MKIGKPRRKEKRNTTKRKGPNEFMKEEKQRDSNRGDENRIKRMNRTKGQKVKPGEE